MQYSQEHLKTMVYAKFGGETECIMGNWKIENTARFLPATTNKPEVCDSRTFCFGTRALEQ